MLEKYKDVLTVKDVCEILLIGRNTVYELLGNGSLKGFRTGNTWKIPKYALLEFIQSGSV